MAHDFLLVDDSGVVRSVLRKALALAGVPVGNVYEAANGEEGLEAVRKEEIDLVFADITMPVMDGQQMIEQMKVEGLMDKVSVVVVSSTTSDPRIDAMREAGVTAFLPKPFTPEQIRSVVEQVLGVCHHAD